jgi:hypothetical protein
MHIASPIASGSLVPGTASGSLVPGTASGSLVPGIASGSTVAQIAASVQSLLAAGDAAGAIEIAVQAWREAPSPELERQMVAWRMQAFAALPRGPGRADWPPRYDDPFPGLEGLPQVAAGALTSAIMGGAIEHHGVVWVKGLASPEKAELLRLDVERAFAARDAYYAQDGQAEPSPWYARAPVETAIADARPFLEEGGGVWTADSPRMLASLIAMFEETGIVGVIEGHLGERPALSIGKSTLRRVPIDTGTDWHQDGSFLGADVRTINVWLALSACGLDAAGLDIVARRVPYVLQTGSHGATFNWSVGPGLVDLLVQGGVEIASPVFEPGDALLFDHLMLHRTGARPNLTKPRWAIETWFFAPSHFPVEQGPVVL